MDDTLAAKLTALVDEVHAAALPEDCKHSVIWCLNQLPKLYGNLRRTSESRHGDEITRLVEGLLKELAASQRATPEAQQIGAGLIDCLQRLHEQFGLPSLCLRPSLYQAVHDRPVIKKKTRKWRLEVEGQASRDDVKGAPRQRQSVPSSLEGTVMLKKSVHAREKELQALLAHPAAARNLKS